MKVPLSAPDITELEKGLVMKVLSGNTLSMGPMLETFEKEFAQYIGSKHAIAVNSGTSGLHLLVRTLRLRPGDEVLTTPFSFVASSNCLLYEGVRPVFVDIDNQTLNIDVNLIKNKLTPRTKAILPVHVFGCPVQMKEVLEISNGYNLKVIEDACEAIGAEYSGRKAGTFGVGGVFAFYPNKQMTTGEGGMIVTDSDRIAELCRSMRNQGRDENAEWLCHERLGYNYRLDEMSAAMGLAQLRRIEEILQKRARVAAMYCDHLREIEEIQLPLTGFTEENTKVSWFVFVIRLKEFIDRNRLMKYLKNDGVDTRTYFNPIHLQSFYQKKFNYQQGDFPVTETVALTTLALPFYSNMTEDQVNYVSEKLKEALIKCRKD